MKKLYLKTYGCQMNVYDSDRMQDIMEAIGYESVDTPDDADMVLINTCHIREKASEKLFSDLGRIRPHKLKKSEKGEQMIVCVAGCVAQAEGEEIFRRSQVVDIIVGPESYQTLPDLVGKVLRDKKKQINLDFTPNEKFDMLKELAEANKEKKKRENLKNASTPYLGEATDGAAMGNHTLMNASAFVTVQEGCDKFCTFCVVPYTRGAEYSRKVSQIVDDAKGLVDQGVKEIYLLGQNVNAYHGLDEEGNASNLAKLIGEINKIPGVERIRYTTSHPRDMSDELIEAHANFDKLMPFLHLPVQSGSNNILKTMNRKHTRQDYIRAIEKLREINPKMGLSSDFIVGFPGETDQDFEDTMDLVRQIGFTQCYSFKYSPRPGTTAADVKTQVPEEVMVERLNRLQALLTEQQTAFNKGFENDVMPVLFERELSKNKNKSDSGKAQLWGKSPWLQSVIVDVESEEEANKYLGQIADVKILNSRPSCLVGELV